MTDPHIAVAREMFVDLGHPKAGRTKLTGAQVKLSETPPQVRAPAPRLGEHNDAVFGSLLGLSSDYLERLRAEGVI